MLVLRGTIENETRVGTRQRPSPQLHMPMNTTTRPAAPANPPSRKSITLLQLLALIGAAGIAASLLFRYFL